MPRKQRGRRRVTQRKRRSLISPLSVLFVLVVLCVGAYWNVHNGASEQLADAKMSQIESGAVEETDANYTDTATDVHDAVDTWLKALDADVTTVATTERSETRYATGGTIQWTTKRKEVVPTKPITREDVEKQLAKSQGKAVLYRVERTQHNGKDVTEYDIAHFTMLDTEQLYLVTDKLYVTDPKPKSGVVASIKKLIQESTSGSLKDVPQETASTADKAKAVVDRQTHPKVVKGRLAIVIDDCGSDMKTLQGLNDLPVPLTYAVMPNKPYTSESAEAGYDAGRKIFVHLPMEPLNVKSSEEVYIGKDMSDGEVKDTAKSLLDQVPHAVGMNNHQGSGATADSRLMKAVMSVVKQRHLLYLDSRTNVDSVGEQTASAMGIGTTRNNLFIDNDKDVASIKKRILQGGQIAKSNGSAVIIGHCRPNTLTALKESIDALHSEGIDVVFVTDLMQ